MRAYARKLGHDEETWAIVGLPLAWGVYQTVLKSLPLFGGH